MNTIVKTSRKLFLFSSITLGILFIVFVLNQFILFYDLLNRINSFFAFAVVFLLGLIMIYFLIKLILLWKRSTKLVIFQEDPTKGQKEEYYTAMIKFLKGNKNIKAVDFDDKNISKESLVDLGFQELDSLSNPVIQTTASQIFLSTAISQNGSLDSIAVLISLIKMVWQLASIYQTRPTLKGMGKLYIQVASVVFMARTIEDSDLIETQIEPLITTILGESVASAIPGMIPITNLVVSSLMEGSLNALLTLRVGIIAQSYLGMEKPETKSFIQKNASLQAFGQMGKIIKINGKLVAKSIVKATKNAATSTAKRWFNYR